jgi:hypothetical protein
VTTGWSPTEFVSENDLRDGVYPVTDGVSDEDFEEAVQAKEEGNLSSSPPT